MVMNGSGLVAFTGMDCARYRQLKHLIEAIVFASWPSENVCVNNHADGLLAPHRADLAAAANLITCPLPGDPIVSALDLEMRGLWRP